MNKKQIEKFIKSKAKRYAIFGSGIYLAIFLILSWIHGIDLSGDVDFILMFFNVHLPACIIAIIVAYIILYNENKKVKI